MPKTEEQCQQIREDTRNRIIKESSLYFARNGFGDTKIGDLANGSSKPWRNDEGYVIMGMKYFLLNIDNLDF